MASNLLVMASSLGAMASSQKAIAKTGAVRQEVVAPDWHCNTVAQREARTESSFET